MIPGEMQAASSAEDSRSRRTGISRWLWRAAIYIALLIFLGLSYSALLLWFPNYPPGIPARWVLANWLIILLAGFSFLFLALIIRQATDQEENGWEANASDPKNRERMLGYLHAYYEQMLAESLQGAKPIALELVTQPTAVHNVSNTSQSLAEEPQENLSSPTFIGDAYAQAQKALLILGAQGGGKSTLLLELAYHLVERAKQDETQPLPFLLPLSSWPGDFKHLQHWMAQQITLLYKVPESLSKQWAKTASIVPLLDGLDEVDASDRATCIKAINTYRKECMSAIVVCSSGNEYETASTHEQLDLHAAVAIQPLTHEQVDTYLEEPDEPLTNLRTTLQQHSTLQKLATTPLLLQILIRTYRGASLQAIPNNESQARQRIWTDYVQRMVNNQEDLKRSSPSGTLRWLGWLAQQMQAHNQTVFFPESPQPDWLPTKPRRLCQLSINLIVGSVVGVASGLFFGVVYGLYAWLFSWQFLGAFLYGFFSGFAGWLLLGILIMQIALHFIGAFFAWLFHHRSRKKKRKPAEEAPLSEAWQSLSQQILLPLDYVAARGLLGPTFLKQSLLVLFYLLIVIQFIILIQVIGGQLSNFEAPIRRASIRYWLAYSNVFPLDVHPFLEETTEHGLLRHFANGYSFTHPLLQAYFAEQERDPAQ